MPNVIKKLDFTTVGAADPFTAVPVGWEYSVGSQQSRTYNISAVSWTAKSIQSNIIDTSPMQGTWIQSTVQLSTSQSNGSGACILDRVTGNGYMVTADTSNGHRLYKTAAGQLNGSSLVQVTQATTPVVSLQKHTLRRNTVTNELQILIEGVLAASVTDATYAPTYGGGQSRYGYLRYIETEYTPDVGIIAFNGGNPVTAGQTGIEVEAYGFTAKPTAVTAEYGGQSITATIGTGTADNFEIDIQDRVDGQDWPLNGTTLTYTFSNSVPETASVTRTLANKSTETVLTYSGVVTDDASSLAYHLAADGFTPEGGEMVYSQPPATGTMPVPDLVLTAEGGWTVSEPCTFESWFRPATGTGAGNVYYFNWIINGGAVVVTGGLTSSGLTSSGLTRVGLTSSGL